MVSGRFLIHLHVSGKNRCCIYKQVPFPISWISAFLSATKRTTHTVKICPWAKFSNIVRCILIFLFSKHRTLCEEQLWQRCFTQCQVLLQNLPGFLSGELSTRCCLPGMWLPPRKVSPFPSAIPVSFRWGGPWHLRSFSSGRPLTVQHFELSSVLRFSSLFQKTPYKQSILDYWRALLPRKALLHKYLMLRKNTSFISAQKELLQTHFITYFLICLGESFSYYGVQVNIRAASVV